MTDRARILTVALDKEYRDDDVEAIINAISMIKGVIAVDIEVSETTEWMAIQTVRRELADKLYKVLYEKDK